MCFAIGIYGVSGQQLSLLDSAVTDDFTDVKAGLNKILCNTQSLNLLKQSPGIYYINIAINYRNSLIYGAERCAEIHVEQGDYYRTGKFPRYGYFLMNYKWSSEELFWKYSERATGICCFSWSGMSSKNNVL